MYLHKAEGAMPVSRLAVALLIIQGAACYSLKECVVHGLGGHQVKLLCYQMGLLHVPSLLPSWLPGTVTNMDVSRNRISCLQQSDFQNLSALQLLNVSQNEIRTIESHTFANQRHLELLNLTTNALTILAESMFTGLGNLTILLLRDNNITTIEATAFAGLQNLRTIDLGSNKLHTLDAFGAVFEVRTLEHLHIGDNGLHYFLTSDLRVSLLNISELDLSRNPLSWINVTSDVLKGLQSLDSSFVGGETSLRWDFQDPCFLNSLKNLFLSGIQMEPPELSVFIQSLSCSSLENIELNYLNLSESDNLVEQICSSHPTLKVLQLKGNNFTGLKEGVFRNCTVLSHLDLNGNHLQHVNKMMFRHLNALQALSLGNNQILTVSDDILQLPTLQILDLQYNSITGIAFNLSASPSHLTHLNLGNNKFTAIGSSSQFEALGNLLELQLGINFVLDIAVPFSPSLMKLKNLELKKNKLNSIRKNTFINLSALRTLNLVANQIESIEPGGFEGLKHLETLLLGSNNIASPLLEKNIFSGLTALRDLQLFSNGISYESSKPVARPPFLDLKSLHTLAINSQRHTGLLNLPANFFDGLVSTEKIHAGNIAIHSVDSRVFHYTPNLKELDLSNNPLTSIDPAVLQPVPKLTELHIQQTSLQSLNFLIETNFTRLILLRAMGNQLKNLNSSIVKALPALLFLDLGLNPFMCSCDNQDFLNWSTSDLQTQVLHFYEYICAYPLESMGQPLYKFDSALCTVNLEFILFMCTSLGAILLMLCCTFHHMCKWQVVYAYYFLRAFLYDRKHKKKAACKCTYDAFVSYNKHNEEWVLSDLLPTLEEQYHWKLCLHHRDFEPGRPILDNIVENIYASRKTICVISRHYLESEWCSGEMQVASYRLFDERKDVLILIFLEEIPSYLLSPYHRMRKLVKKKTYLCWPQKQEEVPIFWQKINLALKTKDDGGEDNPILRVDIPEED
ncbi:toll-like receptor 13 [Ambystoma mexicanum]|uniref:toll-like receptor 13 n=1 Tax=Ambystoma mexicanum TaxID=8296 RepID=UPI0037E8AEE3